MSSHTHHGLVKLSRRENASISAPRNVDFRITADKTIRHHLRERSKRADQLTFGSITNLQFSERKSRLSQVQKRFPCSFVTRSSMKSSMQAFLSKERKVILFRQSQKGISLECEKKRTRMTQQSRSVMMKWFRFSHACLQRPLS